MAIPNAQLESWAKQGATGISSAAYRSLRVALLRQESPLVNRGVEIFLQGSYANATNTYGDSDVDVVVLYKPTFYKDMSALTPEEQQLHEMQFRPATYQWSDLRDDVLTALTSHYERGAVTEGRKSIKVQTRAGGRPSDVVPAVQFRRYATFSDCDHFTAYWGIQFFDSSGNPVVNYPEYHKVNGEKKNTEPRTGGSYKATVRLFKNLRSRLVENGALADRAAPSYFIECALYNVPDANFLGGYGVAVPSIIDYFSSAKYGSFRCQNGIVRLIGDGPTQWAEADYAEFVIALRRAWRNWK